MNSKDALENGYAKEVSGQDSEAHSQTLQSQNEQMQPSTQQEEQEGPLDIGLGIKEIQTQKPEPEQNAEKNAETIQQSPEIQPQTEQQVEEKQPSDNPHPSVPTNLQPQQQDQIIQRLPQRNQVQTTAPPERANPNLNPAEGLPEEGKEALMPIIGTTLRWDDFKAFRGSHATEIDLDTINYYERALAKHEGQGSWDAVKIITLLAGGGIALIIIIYMAQELLGGGGGFLGGIGGGGGDSSGGGGNGEDILEYAPLVFLPPSYLSKYYELRAKISDKFNSFKNKIRKVLPF